VFMRLKSERRSIIANTKNDAPEGAKSISSKKSLIFFSNTKHLAFCNYHIKRNVMLA